MMNAQGSIDCRGLACPMPLVRIKRALKELRCGEVLAASADVDCFDLDVKAWCETTGNPLKALERTGEVVTAYIEKA